jgi:hypothetical protein
MINAILGDESAQAIIMNYATCVTPLQWRWWHDLDH